MSLHKPFFSLKASDGQVRAYHNCNGGIGFCANSAPLDPDTVRLIELALEEGARRRSAEIAKLLTDGAS